MFQEDSKRVVSWFSAGVTSTVATKIALDKFGKDNVDIIFFETGAHHEDNDRFLKNCEAWFGKPIEIVQNPKYKDLWDVLSRGYINSPGGAYCTHQLKKAMRWKLEKERDWDHQIFGFEFNKKEINRAIRFTEQYPNTNPLFPLIEHRIDKPKAMSMLSAAGIELPMMYQLGYTNNNCVGCVKGGMGYWNKIRRDFPEVFDRMAKLERQVGATCLKEADKVNGGSKRLYLDELDPERGREEAPITAECGVVCSVEFADMESEHTKAIMNGELSMVDFLEEMKAEV